MKNPFFCRKVILSVVLSALMAMNVFIAGCDKSGQGETANQTATETQTQAAGKVKMSEKPVILLGIDAMEWSIVNELIAQGKLPNIKHAIETGVSGHLQTLFPTMSPLIWNSMVTGKKPEKHGIVHFVVRKQGSYESIPVSNVDRTAPAIWHIANAEGKSSVFINWWASWPADHVNGVIVTSRLSPQPDPASIYPAEAWTELTQAAGAEPMPSPTAFFPRIADKSYVAGLTEDRRVGLDFLAGAINNDETFARMGLHLLKTRRPDVMGVYLNGLDWISHYLWKFYRPDGFDWSHDPSKGKPEPEFAQIIPKYYEYLDGVVARFISAAGQNADVLIVSDHGFTSALPEKLLGDYPEKEALLGNTKSGLMRYSDPNAIALLDITGLMKRKPDGQPDWSESEVFACGNHHYTWITRFCLNVRGREPEGIISPDALSAKLAEVKAKLESVKTKSGKKLFDKVEIPEAQSLETAGADIIAHMHPFINTKDEVAVGDKAMPFEKFILTATVSGMHTDKEFGVFIATGPDFGKNAKLDGASVLDVAPTVLALAGLPIGEDFDGKVLTGAFAEADKVKIRKLPSLDSLLPESHGLAVDTPGGSADDEEVKRRLRALGYIQ